MAQAKASLDIDRANREAFDRLCNSNPILVDVRPAIEVVPGMTKESVLTSGPPMAWGDYVGGQRAALIGGALYEGLARSAEEADEKFASGAIKLGGCQDYGCVGSVAGIYTASMPVFVVENRTYGNTGFCNFYEGKTKDRLCYGVYNDEVVRRLGVIQNVLGPVLGEAVRLSGGIELKPIMKRALHMGDELHSRNTAASFMFSDRLFPYLLDLVDEGKFSRQTIKDVLAALTEDNYFFLRLSMAAAQGNSRRCRGYRRINGRHRYGCQLSGIRHPGKRFGGSMVLGISCLGGGEALRRAHRRRDHLDGWGEPHGGDRGAGRVRASRRFRLTGLPGRIA